MKIAVPTERDGGLDDSVSAHFGRCSTYTFIDGKGKVIGIMKNDQGHMGGTCSLPRTIKDAGADILLCRDLGPKALRLCEEIGIDVYVSKARTVREIFELWKGNKIEKASEDNICKGHRNENSCDRG
jgi:predicted Fe-Mo cluster-binding NifX family protein